MSYHNNIILYNNIGKIKLNTIAHNIINITILMMFIYWCLTIQETNLVYGYNYFNLILVLGLLSLVIYRDWNSLLWCLFVFQIAAIPSVIGYYEGVISILMLESRNKDKVSAVLILIILSLLLSCASKGLTFVSSL